MLELDNIDTYYGENQVLRGVSLRVGEGRIVTLLGRNGMGKTTTVRSIMGLAPPRRGAVRYAGKEITSLKPYQISQAGIALVPQGRHIFASLSVKENLVMARRDGKFSLDRIYSLFPVLQERGRHNGSQISGGEQQMLAIARAMLTNPRLILMDEPSEGLAPVILQKIGEIILMLKKEGISILLVEQNIALALSVSDDAYIMHKGEIVYQSSTKELAENQEIQAEYIGVSKRRDT